MKLLIKSRKDIEKMSQKPFPEHTALISITDAEGDFATLAYKPEYILQLAFNDVDNDVLVDEVGYDCTDEERLTIEEKYQMFSDEQARQVAEFYLSVKDTAEIVICQCEHGQSRSAAVAAAILEFRSRKGIQIFSHDKYYPNKVVFRKVLNALTNFECNLTSENN